MILQKIRNMINKNRCYCETEINRDQLKRLIDNGAILLDVRSPQEYKEEHLENAILLPSYEIKQKASSVLVDKFRTIIVYCSTGHRSKKAQKMLQQMGYEKVFNLCDGLY